MKKSLALLTFIGLAAATTWYVAVAQDSDRPFSTDADSERSEPSPPQSSPFYSNPQGATPTPFPTTVDSPADSLRPELIRLTETAASLMDEEELQVEVERARLRATTMAADQRLEEIRSQLTELMENYPGTGASATASAMLEIDVNEAAESAPDEEEAENARPAAI